MKVIPSPILLFLACFSFANFSSAQSFSISSEALIECDSDTQSITILQDETRLLTIQSIKFDYTEAESIEIVGLTDDNSLQIRLQFPSSVHFWHHANDIEPRFADLRIQAVTGGIRLSAEPEWAEHITLVLKDTGDHQFGLCEPLQPDNQLSPDLRGKTIDLEVRSDGQTFVENYASAFSSLYMSSEGYGAFFDTYARGRYQFATSKGQHVIHHDTGKLDWYVFFGKNGTSILSSYYQLIGMPKTVPIWAMGPVLWRDDNSGGAAEIMDDAQRFDALKIPATAWFVDRPYSDGAHQWSKMNFGEGFENPEKWIAKLKEAHGVEFMTWTATAFFGDARFNHHLDDWHTYLDLSDPENVQAFKTELKENQYAYGVKGHKMDRADENFPSYAPWHDETIKEPLRRNYYVYLFAKLHHEALSDAWGDDHFNFARAAIHRVQPYLSAIWGGDPRSNWDGFRGNFANAIRSGFLGFPIWGSDVGGYLGPGDIPEDLYVRWLQAGSMSGLFEIKLDGAGGMGNDRVPWHYPESLQNEFRKVCEDRMKMLPTLYSLANTSGKTGVLMQPMAYADLTDPQTYDIWDQFLIGDTILVAPVFSKTNQRRVYLPEGEWSEMDNPKTSYTGGQWIEIEAPLDTLPRFVKNNRLYLTGNIYQGSDRNWKENEPQLTVHVFPGQKGSSFNFTYIDSAEENTEKVFSLKRTDSYTELNIPPLSCKLTIRWNASEKPLPIKLSNGSTFGEWLTDEKGFFVNLPAEQIVEGVQILAGVSR